VSAGGVFINYRGEDSDTAAVLMERELAVRFGNDRVFLDSRSIPAGVDFVEDLLGRLRACSHGCTRGVVCQDHSGSVREGVLA
jgi:hypothetical protein